MTPLCTYESMKIINQITYLYKYQQCFCIKNQYLLMHYDNILVFLKKIKI